MIVLLSVGSNSQEDFYRSHVVRLLALQAETEIKKKTIFSHLVQKSREISKCFPLWPKNSLVAVFLLLQLFRILPA